MNDKAQPKDITEDGVSLIKTSIVACKEKGIKIKPSSWGVEFDSKKGYFVPADDEDSCVCALGAVLVHKNGSIDFKPHRQDGDEPSESLVAAAVLGVDEEWVRAFINGFDSSLSDLRDFRSELVSTTREEEEYEDSDPPESEMFLTDEVDLSEEAKPLRRAYLLGQELVGEFEDRYVALD